MLVLLFFFIHNKKKMIVMINIVSNSIPEDQQKSKHSRLILKRSSRMWTEKTNKKMVAYIKWTPTLTLCNASWAIVVRSIGAKQAHYTYTSMPHLLCYSYPCEAAVKQCLSNQVLPSVINKLSCLSGGGNNYYLDDMEMYLVFKDCFWYSAAPTR